MVDNPMKTKRIPVVVAIGLTMAMGILVAHGAPKELTCRGKVVDSAGKPVSEVEVRAYKRTFDPSTETLKLQLMGKATTLADGTFSFRSSRGARMERCLIVARKTGMALGWTCWRMRKDHSVNIVLGKPDILAGCVDKPVAGAEVRVILSLPWENEKVDLPGIAPFDWLLARTDAKGDFKFTNIPAGARATFMVTTPGGARIYDDGGFKYNRVGIRAGKSDIWIRLPHAATIRGVIIDKKTQKPVKGVRLLVASSGRPLAFPPATAVSGADGTFAITGLNESRYYVKVARGENKTPEWATSPLTIEAKIGGPKKPDTLELIEGGLVEVAITDADTGEPIPGVWVFLTPDDGRIRNPHAYTAHDGVARMRVKPGRYHLAPVPARNYYDSRKHKKLGVLEGSSERFEFQIMKLPWIQGMVRDQAGKPVAEAEVSVLPGGWRRTTTDNAGRFHLRWNRTRWGNRKRIIMVRQEEREFAVAVGMPEKHRVDIQLAPGATIVGRVMDTEGKPIVDARISVNLRMGRGYPHVCFGSQTDKTGHYKINALPPNREYRIVVDANGFTSGYILLNPGKIKKNRAKAKDIVLQPANMSVSGVVVDEIGQPVKGAKVRSSVETVPGIHSEWSVRTGAKGRFTIKGLPKGQIKLFVTVPDTGLRGHIQVEAGNSNVKITVR